MIVLKCEMCQQNFEAARSNLKHCKECYKIYRKEYNKRLDQRSDIKEKRCIKAKEKYHENIELSRQKDRENFKKRYENPEWREQYLKRHRKDWEKRHPNHGLKNCLTCEMQFNALGNDLYCPGKCREERNKERDRLEARKYYNKNKEICHKKSKQYREKHKEILNQKALDNYYQHREEHKAKHRQWLKDHPENVAYHNHKKRARIPIDVKILKRVYQNKKQCLYCGTTEDLTIEHLTPLKRGGDNSYENLDRSCRDCNQSKSRKTHEEFLKYKEELKNKYGISK